MAGSSEPVIIKKKKGGHHGGHHGGAWKVAYADFVTAMMAFFLVMWILGLSESSKKAIAGYFREPGIFSFMTGKALPVDLKLGGESSTIVKQGMYATNEGGGRFKDQMDKDIIPAEVKRKIENEKISKIERELQQQIRELANKNPELKDLLASVSIEMTEEGLRIELADSDQSVFFKLGGAEVNKEARDIFGNLAKELGKLPNNIEIEGHTDARAFPGEKYTNWELSANRANATRKLLEETGLRSGQVVSVTGYADKKLRKPEAPFDTTNRRVSVLVRFSTPTPKK